LPTKQQPTWKPSCDTRTILPTGTPEQVRECVRERFQRFSPGGGYVFQQIHNIMSEVPPEKWKLCWKCTH
jgi:uroporphyrinogen decarboxylase